MPKNKRDYENVSLIDSILDQFGITKLSQGREKAFTQAFYNSITLVIIIVCTILVVLTILQPFIKPLLWAVLCGSVLHPFKFALSSCFKRWICHLEKSSKPFSIEIATVPVFVILTLSEFIGNVIVSKYSAVFLSIFVTMYGINLVYDNTPEMCFTMLWKVVTILEQILNYVMDLFQSTVIITLLLIGFLSAITLLWDSKRTLFTVISYVIWMSIACHVLSYFFTYLRIPAFLLLIVSCFISVIYESMLNVKSNPNIGKSKSTKGGADVFKEFMRSDSNIVEELSDSLSENEGKFTPTNFAIGAEISPIGKSKFGLPSEKPPMLDELLEDSLSSSVDAHRDQDHFSHISGFLQNPHTSDIYIYTVCVGCGIIVIIRNLSLLYFIVLLFIIHLARLFCLGFGIWALVEEFWEGFVVQCNVWYNVRRNVLVPPAVAAFFKLVGVTRCYVLSCLKNYCDAVASVTVILALLSATIFITIFLGIQVYTESFYMIRVSGQIINQTVVHNPELMQLLPEGWQDQVDSVLNSAYTCGRELLSNMLRKMLKDIPEDKASELELTALELWDRVYQAWVMTSLEQSIGPKVTSTAVFQTWGHFLNGVQKTPGLMNFRNLYTLVVENMTSLGTELGSIWVIVKGNANLLLQAITALLSLVISHGAALFSFFINILVFLTALFYLLNSSRVLYKPVEILTNMIPQYGNKLAVAMETASKEVLVASFKMLIFYGLWTWIIHSVFLMNIIYLPSVFAATLSVVPVLGTYWACLPAVLDLWLAQGKGLHAIGLAVCQFLPTTIVDTTIYNEIHGGHPYLTGLAVAGGLLCLGIQGVIIGPLALCGLLVIINLSAGVLQESPNTL